MGILEINNIKKVFNKGTINEHTALDGLSLSVENGDFITIIGSNGAGKSTLFNSIFGKFYLDEGSILLDGEDITFKESYKRSKDIGYLHQDPLKGTAPNMTIEENLSLSFLGGDLKNPFAFVNKKEKKELLSMVKSLDMGLEEYMNKNVGLLSGGQRQALSLIMSTVGNPKLLLLDEHTAALDPKTGEKVLDITKRVVKENNITCLMITHNMEDALKIGNRTIMMKNGKIILDINGEAKKNYTVNMLLDKFKEKTGENLTNDRMILS